MAAVKSKPMAAKPAGKWKLGNMTDKNIDYGCCIFPDVYRSNSFSGRRLFKTTDFF